MFGQEGNAGLTDTETICREIDASLMTLEHVKAEKKIDGLSFQYGESDGQKQVAEFDLRRVNASQDFGGSNPMSDTFKTRVHEAHDAASLSTLGRDCKISKDRSGMETY